MNEDAPVDWSLMMRFGLGVLGLSPRDFWSMTPVELNAAAQGRIGRMSDTTPLGREGLADLMRQNPDQCEPLGGKPQ